MCEGACGKGPGALGTDTITNCVFGGGAAEGGACVRECGAHKCQETTIATWGRGGPTLSCMEEMRLASCVLLS